MTNIPRIATIVDPAVRAARANACAFEARVAGASLPFGNLLATFQGLFTPPQLHIFRDHVARGQKTLTRMDQFRNRRHFKTRA